MNLTPIETCATRELGRSLRTWRALRRVKQHALAELLHVSQTTISRWESGRLVPTPPEQRALRELLRARPDSAADRALASLVTHASYPVHLICDLTHELLAMSPSRERQCHLPKSALLGRSLWRYATDDIVRAESGLDAAGWFDAAPPALEFETRSALDQAVEIAAGRCRWVRLQLSDGSFARLVETLPAHRSESIHAASSPIASS